MKKWRVCYDYAMQTFPGLKFEGSQWLCGWRIVISGIFLGILGVCVAVSEAGGEHRPNVVVILADDLGYGDLSAYGGWIRTPKIDQLAKSGMLMTDFHSKELDRTFDKVIFLEALFGASEQMPGSRAAMRAWRGRGPRRSRCI